MVLNPGMLVYLNHYSGKRPFISSVVDTKQDRVKVQLTEKLKRLRMIREEPIVLSFQDESKIFICEGYLQTKNLAQDFLELRISNTFQMDNARTFERFPVSLYAVIQTEKGKRHVGVVKNISMSGVAISTKLNLKENKIQALEIYLDERVLTIGAEVAWEKKEGLKYEYGLKSIYPDYVVKNTLKLYLSILKDEQESLLRN